MLTNTFCHLEAVGYTRESSLWECGITHWHKVLNAGDRRYISPKMVQGIALSQKALESRDAKYFEERLRASDMWRAWSAFRENACFLDIETTGFRPCDVTVVCLSDWKRVRVFIRGENLRELPKILSAYDLIVTFNGKSFDLPVLRDEFRKFPSSIGHLDLLYPLRSAGFNGGLKRILRRMKITKEGPLDFVEGWMAPLLWDEHENGNKDALETLLAYAVNDVVHLPRLADIVYNKMVQNMPFQLPLLDYREPLKTSYKLNVSLAKRIYTQYEWMGF